MRTQIYPVGTQLRLVRGTTLWGQEHCIGRADLIYEVVEEVDDGTSMERISLSLLGELEPTFIGISGKELNNDRCPF